MKKLIILIIAFTLGVSAYAQEVDTTYYKANKVSFKLQGDKYFSSWRSCEVPVEMIAKRHKLNIYTESPHYIDYGKVYKEEFLTYSHLTAYGTDTNYEDLKIEFFLYKDDTVIIKLTSDNWAVKYNIVNYSFYN